MTQITLNIENNVVLQSLMKLLNFIEGVSIVRTEEVKEEDTVGKTEREAILSAFQQVKKIKEGKIKSRDVSELLNEYNMTFTYPSYL